jgi:hypothetical protein
LARWGRLLWLRLRLWLLAHPLWLWRLLLLELWLFL